MICDSQSLSVSINECLEEWFVMRDGLQDVPIICHIANYPLAQPSAALPEDIAVRESYFNQQLQTHTPATKYLIQ